MTSSSSLAPPGSGSHVESSQDKTPSSEPSPIVFSPRTEFDSARSKEVIEHSEPSSIKSPSPEERFTRLQYNNTGPRLVFHWDPGFSEIETRRTEASLNAQPGDDNALDPDALADLMTPYEDSPGKSRRSRIPKPLRFLGSGKRTKSDRTLFSSLNPQSSLAVVPTITSDTAPETFDETAIPTEAQLSHAASLTVVSEAGVPINFGSLWSGQKTIVAFIRHFWCPNCQDYMVSISQNISVEKLTKACTKLVIISNGSPTMIKTYRKMFSTPYEVYTDQTHHVYNALGMAKTRRTSVPKTRGEYVRHGTLAGFMYVFARAVRYGMPVWAHGGDVAQLGGEFVLGPGLQCSLAHRMMDKASHYPIIKVAAAAGVMNSLETNGTSFRSSSEDSASRRSRTASSPAWTPLTGQSVPLVHRTILRSIPSRNEDLEEARKPEDGWNADEVAALQGEMTGIASQAIEDNHALRIGRTILEDPENQRITGGSQEALTTRQRSGSWEERGLCVDVRIPSTSGQSMDARA